MKTVELYAFVSPSIHFLTFPSLVVTLNPCVIVQPKSLLREGMCSVYNLHDLVAESVLSLCYRIICPCWVPSDCTQ